MSNRPQWAEKARSWLTDGQFDQLDKAYGEINEAVKSGVLAAERLVEKLAVEAESVGLWALCVAFDHEPEGGVCVYCHKEVPTDATD